MKEGQIEAPFTKEQVEALNNYQNHGMFHPFTCCSHEGCERSKREDQGLLIATEEGWVCPCGKWKQNWAHEFMAEPLRPDPFKHIFNPNDTFD